MKTKVHTVGDVRYETETNSIANSFLFECHFKNTLKHSYSAERTLLISLEYDVLFQLNVENLLARVALKSLLEKILHL